MIVNGVLILLGLFLLFGIFSIVADILIKIKTIITFKKIKGKFVVGTFIKNENHDKTREIYYCVEIRERGYSSSPDLSKALIFDNQYKALEVVRKCSFENLFVIKM